MEDLKGILRFLKILFTVYLASKNVSLKVYINRNNIFIYFNAKIETVLTG